MIGGFSYDPEAGVCYRTLDFMGIIGYRVGDDGSVWSRRRLNRWGISLADTWHILKQTPTKNNRITVTLKGRRVTVYRLVLFAFVGSCPEGMECCHFPDRDRNNNRLTNLRWDTKKANAADKAKHGTQPHGNKHWWSKLTETAVLEMRKQYAAGGVSYAEIARQRGVSHSAAMKAIKGHIWRHVNG